MAENVVRGDAAEADLERFIERRALKTSAEQERVEDLWREQELAHRERVRRENRAAWYAHEVHMSELHEDLAREHAEKAQALLEGGAHG